MASNQQLDRFAYHVFGSIGVQFGSSLSSNSVAYLKRPARCWEAGALVSSNGVLSTEVSSNKVSSNDVSSNGVSSNEVSSIEVSSTEVSFTKNEGGVKKGRKQKKNTHTHTPEQQNKQDPIMELSIVGNDRTSSDNVLVTSRDLQLPYQEQ